MDQRFSTFLNPRISKMYEKIQRTTNLYGHNFFLTYVNVIKNWDILYHCKVTNTYTLDQGTCHSPFEVSDSAVTLPYLEILDFCLVNGLAFKMVVFSRQFLLLYEILDGGWVCFGIFNLELNF